MIETFQPPPDPLAHFPYLRGEMSANYHENLTFAVHVLHGFNLNQSDPAYHLAIDATARCLDEVDRLYGSGVDSLGAGYHSDPWASQSLPAFYHNGLRTKVAIADTVTYMHWANQQARYSAQPLPYQDAETIYGTLLAAAFDDLVFTGKRIEDEDASRSAAQAFLTEAGAPATLIEAVDIAIDASKFNESTGRQAFDPSRGARAEQAGSLVGDLWGLGTPQGTANTFMLAIENMWKAGPPINTKGGRILYDLACQQQWRGNTLQDFFSLVQSNDDARAAFGNFLETNRGFIVNFHQYPDPKVDQLLAAGKHESATLQENLGRAIKENYLSIHEAFECALAYARTRIGWEHQTSILPRAPISSNDIARIVLTRNSIQELTHPVSAQDFFDRYTAELGR